MTNAARGEPEGLLRYLSNPARLDAVWLTSALAVPVLLALLRPILPFDYFWPLVQGRLIAESGRIAAENGFLYTLPRDAPFVNQPWLAEVALYVTYRLGGHAGNLILLALLLALSSAFVLDAALRVGGPPKGVALATLLGLPFVMYGAGARTQMFALPCFALVLRFIVLAPRTSETQSSALGAGAALRTRLFAFLPVLGVIVLWSNCHGSFVLAPLMLGVRALFRLIERERWPLVELVLAALGTALNPLGPAVYGYALRLGSLMEQSNVTEWAPLRVQSWLGAGFVALVALGVLGFARAPLREARPLLTLFLLFSVLSLKSLRFIGWWGMSVIVLLPWVWRGVAERLDAPGRPLLNRAFVGLWVLLVLASLPGAPGFRLARRTIEGISEATAFGKETPFATVERLAQRGYSGRLFHAQALGGLLEWTLCGQGPRPVTFVDQRFELTPSAVWDDYFAISDARTGWKALLDRYGVGTLLIHEEENRKLLGAVARDPEFVPAGAEYGYRLYVRAR